MSDMAAAIDVTRGPAGSDADRQARAARDATALAYLNGRGLDDIAVILGLLPAPRLVSRAKTRDGSRRCVMCGDEYLPRSATQQSCSRSCGARLAGKSKRDTLRAGAS